MTVLGSVNVPGIGAEYRCAMVSKCKGEVVRYLATSTYNNSLRFLKIQDVEYALEGKLLEIQTVRNIVIRRDGLGVGVDHNGIECARLQST